MEVLLLFYKKKKKKYFLPNYEDAKNLRNLSIVFYSH